jgi:hypothetical protein
MISMKVYDIALFLEGQDWLYWLKHEYFPVPFIATIF